MYYCNMNITTVSHVMMNIASMHTDRCIADCSEDIELCQSSKRIHMPQGSTERLVENVAYPSTAASATSQLTHVHNRLDNCTTRNSARSAPPPPGTCSATLLPPPPPVAGQTNK